MLTLSSLVLLVLILLSAYFAASETALFSLSPLKLKAYETSTNARERLIAQLLRRPKDLLVTVFMLNTLVIILLQNVTSNVFAEGGWLLKVALPLVVTLVFGEIIPKYIGIQNNVSISSKVAPSINFFQNLLKPFRELIVKITNPISRVMFFFLKREESISKEELQHVLKRSEEHGVMNPDEADLIAGYLELLDTSVKELMWPREDIIYYDISLPLTKLIHLFVDRKCSRIPICDGNIQKVLGILSAKQYFVIRSDIKAPKDLLRYLAKPLFIPENTSARVLRRKFDETHQVMAMCVDEYGQITGLITYEDIVEVVVGNIADSRDLNPLFTRSGKNEIIASGKLELSSFNEIFDAQLESPSDMVTVGGWLTERLGDIPKSGSKYEFEGFLFQVLAADPNRVRRLYIRKLPKAKEAGGKNG